MPANRFSYITPPGTESRVAPYWAECAEIMAVMCRSFVATEAHAAYLAKQARQPYNAALAQLWANAIDYAQREAFPTWSDIPLGFRIIAI